MKEGKLMPGEFRQDVVHIGIECRNVLQHYYAIGGFAASFATFKAHIKEISAAKALLTDLCVEFTDFDYRSIRTIILDFPQGLPRAYSMVIHKDNLALGFDKVAAIFNLEGALVASYTLIDREAEEDISRQKGFI